MKKNSKQRTVKTGREIVEAHIEYFLKQDINVVCRILAGVLLDNYRLVHIHALTIKEREKLMQRIERNAETLRKFMINGASGELVSVNVGCEDEE